MTGPAAPRRDSGLEAAGRWFRPQQKRRASRHGFRTERAQRTAGQARACSRQSGCDHHV